MTSQVYKTDKFTEKWDYYYSPENNKKSVNLFPLGIIVFNICLHASFSIAGHFFPGLGKSITYTLGVEIETGVDVGVEWKTCVGVDCVEIVNASHPLHLLNEC